MKRFLLLIIIAGALFLIIVFINRPDLIEKIWIWLIGLSGSILKSFKLIINYLKDKFFDNEEENATKPQLEPQTQPQTATENPIENPIAMPNTTIETPKKDTFKGVTLKVLRFSDDNETTIGLFYINEKFYCYTLEDSYRKVKIPGETRIPSGTYKVDFMKYDTKLTLKYRNKYPDWFTHHLHIQNVPNFTGVYIHSGGTHKSTEGCLLVSDSLNVSDDATYFTNSRNTFKELYVFISKKLNANIPVRIVINDENWIKKLN